MAENLQFINRLRFLMELSVAGDETLGEQDDSFNHAGSNYTKVNGKLYNVVNNHRTSVVFIEKGWNNSALCSPERVMSNLSVHNKLLRIRHISTSETLSRQSNESVYYTEPSEIPALRQTQVAVAVETAYSFNHQDSLFKEYGLTLSSCFDTLGMHLIQLY